MIRKQPFQLNESHKNGLLFHVQYIVSSPGGDVLRSRFIFASFDKNGERLAVVDHRYTVFIVDLTENKFWQLKKLTSCTLLSFCQGSNDLMVGYSSGNLALFNCETGEELTQLKGHKIPPHMFSFSSDGLLCLTSGPTEGIIWDMKTKTPAHCLMLQPDTTITQVLFMPVSNNIIACFQDNVIHIWQLGSFECIKQVVPDAWQGSQIRSIAFTRNGRAMVLGGESLQLVVFMLDDWSTQRIIELPLAFGGISKLEFIADLFDGGANKMLAVLGINGDLCFLDLESAQPVSKLFFHGVENFMCGPSGKYLSCITASGDVKIFSLAKVLNNRKNHLKTELVTNELGNNLASEENEGSARTKPYVGRKSSSAALSNKLSELKLNVSPELQNLNRTAANERITKDCNHNDEGESNSAQKEQIMKESKERIIKESKEWIIKESTSASSKNTADIAGQSDEQSLPVKSKRSKKPPASVRHSAQDHLEHLNAKIEKALDLEKIQRILKEKGELPGRYRSVIWRTVLRLPNNIGVYRSLVERGIHPAWSSLAEDYNLSNKTLLNNLQSVLSCLTHWCSAIAELPYMPNFVFPFVRCLQNNSFVCFEAVMTIIVNWCQHWFEFLSFPPLNVLAMIENALTECDLKVLNIFYDAGITTKTYAWPLLSTAFSEVLSPNEWLRLWDHVLCNPPWFLILAVVSYNSCCRVALKSCSSEADFEDFYRRQNPIDMDQFINKTYELCDKLSASNHPRQYLRPFEPLPQGNYPVLSGLPMYIMDYKNQQRNSMQRKEEEFLREEHELLQLQLKINEEYEKKKLQSVQQARFRDMEESTRKAIEKEEDRLRQKRRELSALHAEIRNHEQQLISKAHAQLEEELSRQQCVRIAELREKLEAKSKEVNFEQESLFNEQRTQYARLAALRRELQIRLDNVCSSEGNKVQETLDPGVEELVQQNERLTEKLRQMQEVSNKEQLTSNITMAEKLTELDRKAQEEDLKLAEDALRVQDYLLRSQKVVEGTDLDAKTKGLRAEVNKMLKELEMAYLRRRARSEHNCTSSTQPRSTGASSLSSGNDVSSSLKNTDASFCGSSNAHHRSHRPGVNCRTEKEALGPEILPSVRTNEFYKREKAAVDSAMRVRAALLTKRR